MRLYLGVDGGQSSTTALIGDETGRILGSGAGGPCNHVGTAEGRAKLTRAVTECVSAACTAAGLDFATLGLDAACFGMSGGPADKHDLLATLIRADHWIVTTDAAIALSGATAGGEGVITIAGTGSIAYGRNAQDRTARAGGWGYAFGDEGGGYDITRQATRAALRQHEGWGPATALHDALLTATGAADANALVHAFYTSDYPRPRIASYARLVDETARAGDPVALEILHNAARQLATLTAAVRRQLWPDAAQVDAAYIGGVFNSEIVLARYRTLVELDAATRVIAPKLGPTAGALLEAYRARGLRPDLRDLPAFKQ